MNSTYTVIIHAYNANDRRTVEFNHLADAMTYYKGFIIMALNAGEDTTAYAADLRDERGLISTFGIYDK